MDAHEFVDGGGSRSNARGRVMVLCATCQGPRNSPSHRRPNGATNGWPWKSPVIDQSLRARVLAALEAGTVADIRALEDAIRRQGDSFGHHELMHIVHSLGKQGLVTFQEKKQGNGAQHTLHSIRLRPKSAGAGPVVRTRPDDGDRQLERLKAEARNRPELGEPIDDSPQVADRAIRAGKPEDYPLIAALVGRRQAINEAARHLEAAGLIELALEALSKIDDLTPLEKEVLRFFSIERPGSVALTSPPSLASAPGGTAGTST